MDGEPVVGRLAADLGERRLGPDGGRDDGGSASLGALGVVIGEEDGGEGLLHVDPDVERQHTQEDVGPYSVLSAVADQLDFEGEVLQDPKRALGRREP